MRSPRPEPGKRGRMTVKQETAVVTAQMRDPEHCALQAIYTNGETYMLWGEPHEPEFMSYQLLAGMVNRQEVCTA